MEWYLIPTGRVKVDPGGAFGVVPRTLWQRFHTIDDNQLIDMDLHSLLVRSEGKWILVDNGLGHKMNAVTAGYWHLTYPQGNLIENLAKLSLNPDDIDVVINTHLHSDHCGGNTQLVDGIAVPTFPNAEYIVQRREYEDACNPNARTRATYLPDNFRPVEEAGQMNLVDGDYEVTREVRCISTPGHSPGHQSVILDDGNEKVLFVGDLATYAVNFAKLAWVTAYDVEPLVNIETKRKWQQWAQELNALLVFEHEVETPLGRLEHVREDKYKIAKVEEHKALRLLG